MKTEYKWTRAPKNAPKAQVAGEYIASIKAKRGGVTSRLLEIEASKKRSPLHNCFEWDDTKAGKAYRIEQARGILRFLVVKVIDEDESESEEDIYVRAFISPQETERDNGTSYVTIEEVCSDEDLHKAYLRQLKSDLEVISNKVKSYVEFAKVVKAIEAVVI